MKRSTKVATIVAAAALVAAAGAGIAGAANAGHNEDQPITGAALSKATAAALAHTGAGRVTGTEVGDEDSYYEVEVTFDDGHQVDVQLDQRFNVVKTMSDSDTSGDTGS
jgi:hypothetical protein